MSNFDRLYNDGLRKFIYLSDRLILVQKVEKYEDELIQKEMKK